MVGYTDLHGSLDCAADWRDPQRLCMDLIDCPQKVQELVRLANENFVSRAKPDVVEAERAAVIES
jgi:hypothetical protein